MAADASVPFLGRVPLDPNIVRACEEGSSFLSTFPDSVAAESFQNIVTRAFILVNLNFLSLIFVGFVNNEG